MISKNLVELRKKFNMSQEIVAEKINVSRQTISKWESGESVPDVIHCNELAKLYDVTIDDIVNSENNTIRGIAPKGKYIFGSVTVGEKGQIVIPIKARRIFNIKAGDSLMVLGDINQGIALANMDFFIECFEKMKDEKEGFIRE